MNINPLHCDADGANTKPVVEILSSQLLAAARERVIRQTVAGARFCAVTLDDGSTGVANLCPDVCGQPSRDIEHPLPAPGTPGLRCVDDPGATDAIGLRPGNC